MNGFEIGGTGDGLDLLGVFPPVVDGVDVGLGRVEVDSQNFFLVGVTLLAGGTL